MRLRNCRHNLLLPTERSKPVSDLIDGRLRTGHISLIHDDHISHLEHHNLLQLQSGTIPWRHDEHRHINRSANKRHRLLSNADCLDDQKVKWDRLENLKASLCFLGHATGSAVRGKRPHEHAVILRGNHRGAIPKQGPLAKNTRIVRQDRHSRCGVCLQVSPHQFVDECCLASTAGAGDTNGSRPRVARTWGHLKVAEHARECAITHAAGRPAAQAAVRRAASGCTRRWPAGGVTEYKFHDVLKRRASKKYFIHALAGHLLGVIE